MAAVEGAVTAGRSSAMRPFGASAIPSSRGDSHVSFIPVPRCVSTRRNSSRRSLPRRSASPRRVLTRPRLAGRGQLEISTSALTSTAAPATVTSTLASKPAADHASFDAAVETSSRASVSVWEARSWTSVDMPLNSSLSGALRRGSVMMFAPLRFAYQNLHADSTTSPSKSHPRPPHRRGLRRWRRDHWNRCDRLRFS